MGFLDKMIKDVEKGVGRAQFEADKLMKINTLKGELEKLKRDRRDLLVEIGEEAVALYASHEINLPGLDMQLARLSDLTQALQAKEAELKSAEALQFAGATPPPAAAPAPTPPAEPAAPAAPTVAPAARPTFCANCGAKLPAVGAFCPECGAKI